MVAIKLVESMEEFRGRNGLTLVVTEINDGLLQTLYNHAKKAGVNDYDVFLTRNEFSEYSTKYLLGWAAHG